METRIKRHAPTQGDKDSTKKLFLVMTAVKVLIAVIITIIVNI
jgi:hypothetical protein